MDGCVAKRSGAYPWVLRVRALGVVQEPSFAVVAVVISALGRQKGANIIRETESAHSDAALLYACVFSVRVRS